MDDILRRRTVLGAAASGVAVSLAGCLGGDDEEIEADTYGSWFQGARNFQGTVDETDSDEVTVLVGANAGFSYDPAAVRVTTGTTIIWEWTGNGGLHNVEEEDKRFESEMYQPAGETFSYTFEEPGVYRYVCTPHVESHRMVGAVEVVDEQEPADEESE